MVSTKDIPGNRCRFCGTKLLYTFVDLGMSPLCESFLDADKLNEMEPFYPLHTFVCEKCLLVQLEVFVSGEEIFGGEYAYFSSYSDSWVLHAKHFVEKVHDRFDLNQASKVVEIASNDGYLLQHFLPLNIPVLGIEPSTNVAQVAIDKGIPTLIKYFGSKIAREIAAEYGKADLIIGNNVLAHVPALNDFVKGLKTLLKQDGVVAMEFPHIMRLIEENQFDTIYHEHFSYFSFYTVQKVFAAHELTIFDVQELSTHGGSLRIYACHAEDQSKIISKSVQDLIETEKLKGLHELKFYLSFETKVKKTKTKILEFLINAKKEGKSIAGYGAPGKGNTLLNYCGIRTDFIEYLVDRSLYKQGKFTPGTHIPILPPERIKETKPDFLFILPWNIKEEIMNQMSCIHDWGGKFVVPIPKLTIYN